MEEKNNKSEELDQAQMYLHDTPISGFQPPTKLYITSIFNQYAGKRDQALADLQIYLTNPVGVGEHGDVGEEIKRKIEEVDKYNSLVECFEKHILKHFTNTEADLGPSPQ